MSLPLGCSSLLLNPTPTTNLGLAGLQQQARALVAAHQDKLHHLLAGVSANSSGGPGGAFVVVTGGTATTAAALLLGLKSYERRLVHHSALGPLSKVESLASRLLDSCQSSSPAHSSGGPELSAWPAWLTDSRMAVMPAGCVALVEVVRAVCQTLGEDEDSVLVSDRDLLDALLDSMLMGDPM